MATNSTRDERLEQCTEIRSHLKRLIITTDPSKIPGIVGYEGLRNLITSFVSVCELQENLEKAAGKKPIVADAG